MHPLEIDNEMAAAYQYQYSLSPASTTLDCNLTAKTDSGSILPIFIFFSLTYSIYFDYYVLRCI